MIGRCPSRRKGGEGGLTVEKRACTPSSAACRRSIGKDGGHCWSID